MSNESSGDLILNRWPDAKPKHALICGSGWGEVGESFSIKDAIPYEEFPRLGASTVEGHAGQLLLAEVSETEILIFQGRRHYYEGMGWEPVSEPIRISKMLGVETLLLTNAAGGINEDFSSGDLMALTDHINLMPGNPLLGPHDSFLGPRFPDQTEVYDPILREKLLSAGNEHGISLKQGVYLALSGPAFETPAEIRAFGKLGADAVGMSTVPEAMTANAAGLRVAAISCISNLAAGISPSPLSHEEVSETASLAMPRMKEVTVAYLKTLCRVD